MGTKLTLAKTLKNLAVAAKGDEHSRIILALSAAELALESLPCLCVLTYRGRVEEQCDRCARLRELEGK